MVKKIRFNKVVKDNNGVKKKIKRVNITRLAYSIINKPLSKITPKYMLELLNKNKQTNSCHRAKKEVLRALDKLEDRILIAKGPIIAIGCYYIENDLNKIIDWTTKLSTAAEALQSVY